MLAGGGIGSSALAQTKLEPYFVGLGDLPSGTQISAANGVSFDGQFVVGYGSDQNGQQAVAWQIMPTGTPGGTPTVQVFTLAPLVGSSPAEAKAVTTAPDGKTYIVGSNAANGVQQAVRWELNTTPGGNSTPLPLGSLTPTNPRGQAWGITPDGQTVIGQSVRTDSATLRTFNVATYWQIDPTNNNAVTATELTDLPKQGSTGTQSFARAITRVVTPQGVRDIVTGFGNSGVIQTAKWTVDPSSPASGQTVTGLPDLPGGSFSESQGRGISTDGNVVVGYGISNKEANGGDSIEAALWDQRSGNTPIGLGDLPDNPPTPNSFFSSQANGVSGNGAVVVGHGDSTKQDGSGLESEAFIYTVGDPTNPFNNVMRPLKDVLVNDLHLDLTGWELTEAFAISGDGSTIVGYGLHNGVQEAFMVNIPEPSSAAAIALASLAVLRRRRRRRQLV
jgi:hypothetical protein